VDRGRQQGPTSGGGGGGSPGHREMRFALDVISGEMHCMEILGAACLSETTTHQAGKLLQSLINWSMSTSRHRTVLLMFKPLVNAPPGSFSLFIVAP